MFGLTERQITRLDMADVYDISCHVPGAGVMPDEYRNKYYKLFMSGISHVELNPWDQLLITTAVNRWKEKRMENMKITDFVTPDQIVEAFQKVRTNAEVTYKTQIELEQAKNSLDEAIAKESTNPDFKWGKNEDERKAQRRSLFPASVIHIDALEKQLTELRQQDKLNQLLLQQYRMIIDMFAVYNGQGK